MQDSSPSQLKLSLTAAVGGVLVMAALLAAVAQPARAEYRQFCWGVQLAAKNTQNYTCDSWNTELFAGYITEVGGSGANHSVCVKVWGDNANMMCSGGPNQGVYNFTPNGDFLHIAEIVNNATGGPNRVYGFVDKCASPCPG
jgi:hypothetical protein